MKKLAHVLLAISFVTSWQSARAVELHNYATADCYTEAEVEQLALGITDLEKCRIALRETNELLSKRLTMSEVERGAAWWQEPTFVWGGMVVGFSSGALLAWWLTR